MTSAEIAEFLNISTAQLALALNVTRRTLYGYDSGRKKSPLYALLIKQISKRNPVYVERIRALVSISPALLKYGIEEYRCRSILNRAGPCPYVVQDRSDSVIRDHME